MKQLYEDRCCITERHKLIGKLKGSISLTGERHSLTKTQNAKPQKQTRVLIIIALMNGVFDIDVESKHVLPSTLTQGRVISVIM